MPRTVPVTEVMTREVVSVQPETTVEEALALLSHHRISGAPVVDEQGRLVALLDDSDLIVSDARLHGPTMLELLGAWIPLPWEQRRFQEDLQHALAQTVADVAHPDPPAVTAEATIEDVATLMVDHDVARIPVVDEEQRVVGIVTRGDLVGAMGRGQAAEPG